MDLSPSEPIDKKALNQISGTADNTGVLTVDQLDIEILPVIYDIIRCVEKDPLDNAAKLRESQECSQKILELQKRFESARNQIKQLPGIDYNKEEQLQKLELLKTNNEQLIQRMAESYPMRRAAQLVVSLMYRTRDIAERRGIADMTPEKFKSLMRGFRSNLKQEIEGVKEEIKRRK